MVRSLLVALFLAGASIIGPHSASAQPDRTDAVHTIGALDAEDAGDTPEAPVPGQCAASRCNDAEALARGPGGGKSSCLVQKALLTARIAELVQHLKDHPKDERARAGALKLIARRRALPC